LSNHKSSNRIGNVHDQCSGLLGANEEKSW
jgi:hypothetical protein